jgi:hypothetical protein
MTTGDKKLGNEKIVFERGNLKLVLDQQQIFPEDPGLGTPAMVYLKTKDGTVCSTYWCYLGEGTVDCYELTDAQMAWLNKHEEMVYTITDAWYDLAQAKLSK